jgi:hypothetical protein
MYIRSDQALIQCSFVGGGPIGDVWATYEGGDLEADGSKTRPGGMGRKVALGGPADRNDVTVTTQFTDVIAGLHPALEAQVGIGRVKVALSWLGPDRTPTGESQSVVGVINRVAVPNADSDDSDPGMYEMVVQCDQDAV